MTEEAIEVAVLIDPTAAVHPLILKEQRQHTLLTRNDQVMDTEEAVLMAIEVEAEALRLMGIETEDLEAMVDLAEEIIAMEAEEIVVMAEV